MKHIFLNLKRFDVKRELGGVNDIANANEWGAKLAKEISQGIEQFKNIDFAMFVPEGHIINASANASEQLAVGCQGVFRRDVEVSKNFGAFTTLLTAKSASGLGATYAIIGHCEERNNLREIIELGGGKNLDVVNTILNEEIKCAINAGLKVLYCVGERTEEQECKKDVLTSQINDGLKDINLDDVVVAYEPVWAIGPGKPVPTQEYIDEVAKIIKKAKACDVIYGGGLKLENAEMIAKTESLDGGLIALTTFGADFGFSVENYLKIVKKYSESI